VYTHTHNERVGLRHFDGETSSIKFIWIPEVDGSIVFWWLAWR